MPQMKGTDILNWRSADNRTGYEISREQFAHDSSSLLAGIKTDRLGVREFERNVDRIVGRDTVQQRKQQNWALSAEDSKSSTPGLNNAADGNGANPPPVSVEPSSVSVLTSEASHVAEIAMRNQDRINQDVLELMQGEEMRPDPDSLDLPVYTGALSWANSPRLAPGKHQSYLLSKRKLHMPTLDSQWVSEARTIVKPKPKSQLRQEALGANAGLIRQDPASRLHAEKSGSSLKPQTPGENPEYDESLLQRDQHILKQRFLSTERPDPWNMPHWREAKGKFSPRAWREARRIAPRKGGMGFTARPSEGLHLSNIAQARRYEFKPLRTVLAMPRATYAHPSESLGQPYAEWRLIVALEAVTGLSRQKIMEEWTEFREGADMEGKTTMSYEAFRELLPKKMGLTNQSVLRRMYAAFNIDSQVGITFEEYMLGLQRLKRQTAIDALASLFEELDTNQDGEISKEEVMALLDNLHAEMAELAEKSGNEVTLREEKSYTDLRQFVDETFESIIWETKTVTFLEFCEAAAAGEGGIVFITRMMGLVSKIVDYRRRLEQTAREKAASSSLPDSVGENDEEGEDKKDGGEDPTEEALTHEHAREHWKQLVRAESKVDKQLNPGIKDTIDTLMVEAYKAENELADIAKTGSIHNILSSLHITGGHGPSAIAGMARASLRPSRPKKKTFKRIPSSMEGLTQKSKRYAKIATTVPVAPTFSELPSERRKQKEATMPHYSSPRDMERIRGAATPREHGVQQMKKMLSTLPRTSSKKIATPRSGDGTLATKVIGSVHASPGRHGSTTAKIWTTHHVTRPHTSSTHDSHHHPVNTMPYYSYASPTHFRSRTGRGSEWMSGFSASPRQPSPRLHYSAPWRSDRPFVTARK